MIGVTEKQIFILTTIQDYIRAHGYPPTVREIGQTAGISSLRGVTVHLDALERKQLLQRGMSLARGMRITALGIATLASAGGDPRSPLDRVMGAARTLLGDRKVYAAAPAKAEALMQALAELEEEIAGVRSATKPV